uniref:Uncharacterized protein n=1 Tax=Tetradesmus obliquus TaxID=3088 RepID=A0A383WLS1_TETOB|eukprot:jgi/Sobl393_1/12919/SZX78203.1
MSQSGDGSMSQSSYSTGADSASTFADTADRRAINDLQEREDGLASDLVEQNRTVEDAVFASLYTLSKNRKATDLRWTAGRIVLEFLQMFRVVFNTVFRWKINTDLWIWKASAAGTTAQHRAATCTDGQSSMKMQSCAPSSIAWPQAASHMCAASSQLAQPPDRSTGLKPCAAVGLVAAIVFYWVLFRLVVTPKGYDAYIAVFYAVSAVILVSLALTVWVAVILKKDDSGNAWLRRLVAVLQLVAFLLYSLFWVAIMDYISFLFNCQWGSVLQPEGAAHTVFTNHSERH